MVNTQLILRILAVWSGLEFLTHVIFALTGMLPLSILGLTLSSQTNLIIIIIIGTISALLNYYAFVLRMFKKE